MPVQLDIIKTLTRESVKVTSEAGSMLSDREPSSPSLLSIGCLADQVMNYLPNILDSSPQASFPLAPSESVILGTWRVLHRWLWGRKANAFSRSE